MTLRKYRRSICYLRWAIYEFNSAINLVSKVGESFFNIGHYDKTDRPVIIGKKKGLAFAKGSEELKRCWK